MAKMKGVVVVNTERCKGCNLCVVACPLKVLALTPKVNQKGYNYVQQVVEDTHLQRLFIMRYRMS